MKVTLISGSVAGTKTRAAVSYAADRLSDTYPDQEPSVIDLREKELLFADGRNYLDYPGDTGAVVREVMGSDVLIVGSPIYQASMPGALKNLFDLLPTDGLQDKVVSMIVTAGSQRHNLIPELQFKPIFAYLKGQIVQNYVFVEEKDIHRGEIVDDDVYLRIDRLLEDTVTLAEVWQEIRRRKDTAYGF